MVVIYWNIRKKSSRLNYNLLTAVFLNRITFFDKIKKNILFFFLNSILSSRVQRTPGPDAQKHFESRKKLLSCVCVALSLSEFVWIAAGCQLVNVQYYSVDWEQISASMGISALHIASFRHSSNTCAALARVWFYLMGFIFQHGAVVRVQGCLVGLSTFRCPLALDFKCVEL